ncbi:hypothetical protein QR680_017180 [Steinernema hermaphroditum]|uniref:UPF3 domain-containing protein n=1 Tax=Steinernema hermaphroditum TaxID=289476 RepID=A0AA39LNJ2_9BILA|nr:hypothetical protein QR680_017180 [Steinernema hermaphroditum]
MSSQKQPTAPQSKTVKGRGSNHYNATVKEPTTKEKPLKIVLRRLPMHMTWDDLQIQLAPIPKYIYHRFCAADKRLRPNAFARAYFAFRSRQDAIKFRDRFNGYVFMDKNGYESTGIVELAPNYNIPTTDRSEAKENDYKSGTMENDPEFKIFAAEYNKPQEKRKVDFEAIIKKVDERERQIKDGEIKETPLTDFIIQRTVDRIRRIAEKKRVRDEKFGSSRGKARGWFAETKKAPVSTPTPEKEKKPAYPKAEKKAKHVDKEKPPRAEPNPNGNRRERRAAAALERRQAKGAAPANAKVEILKKPQPAASPAIRETTEKAASSKEKTIVIPCGKGGKDQPRRTLVFKSTKRDNATSTPAQAANSSSASTPSSSVSTIGRSSATTTGGSTSSSSAVEGPKRDRPAPSGRPIRNKDRPERALYQPGQRRRGEAAPAP